MRIKFPESRRNWHDIYRDPMEERLFCFNDGPSGGDEPDGVTFTSGDDYVPGQGIQISSSTLAPGSETDTYRGRNTSDAALGAFAAADPFAAGAGTSPSTNQMMMDRASSAPSVAAPPAIGALASSPSSLLTVAEQAEIDRQNRAADANLISMAQQRQRDLIGQNITQDLRNPSRPDNVLSRLEASNRQAIGDLTPQEQFQRDAIRELNQARVNTGITRAGGATAQNVLGGGISTLDTTDDARAQATRGVTTSRPQMQGPPRMPDQIFDIDTRPDIVKDQQLADQIMASSQGVDRDSEVVSALSDNFLDERGRRDVGILGKQIAEYFDSPIVQAGQFAEGLFKSKNDMGGMSRPDSLFTDKAGLPSFGSLGDMTKAVQAGGRLTTDESGNPLFVTMPDGSTVGGTTQASNLMTGGGGGGGGSATAQKSPTDPCPPGYKMVDGVCQPDGTSTDGSGTVTGDTRFSPFYTPVEVGKISPFILQPYTNES